MNELTTKLRPFRSDSCAELLTSSDLRMPAAIDPEGSATAQHAVRLSRLVDLRWHAGSHPSRAFCGVPRARRAGSSPTAAIIDSQSVKSAEKGGPASIRMAMMQAKRSKVRSVWHLVSLSLGGHYSLNVLCGGSARYSENNIEKAINITWT